MEPNFAASSSLFVPQVPPGESGLPRLWIRDIGFVWPLDNRNHGTQTLSGYHLVEGFAIGFVPRNRHDSPGLPGQPPGWDPAFGDFRRRPSPGEGHRSPDWEFRPEGEVPKPSLHAVECRTANRLGS